MMMGNGTLDSESLRLEGINYRQQQQQVFFGGVVTNTVAIGSFPTWSFPKSKIMEWNRQHPIHVNVRETITNATEYDYLVIGVILPPKKDNNNPSSRSNTTHITSSSGQRGWLFRQLDAKHSGILSKRVEGTGGGGGCPADRTTSPGRTVSAVSEGKGADDEEWEEISKTCIVNIDGTLKFQQLVLYRIRGSLSTGGCYVDNRTLGRAMGSKLASKLKNQKGGKWAMLLPQAFPLPSRDHHHDPHNDSKFSQLASNDEFLTELTTTLWTDLYTDNRFKCNPKEERKSRRHVIDEPTSELDLIWDHPNEKLLQTTTKATKATTCAKFLAQARNSIFRGECIASGIFLAKDLVNTPHEFLSSMALAETVKRLAVEYPERLSCQILNAEDCKRIGMGAFLGVSRGSEIPPQLLHLIYKPPRRSRTKKMLKLGIVGKGVLFDTGGYNIKRGLMELMKFDCGGAAAILGAAKAVAQLEPDCVEVHFVVAACENKVNDKSLVPGDVLTALNGKTIEVLNTDREGRLTLADALVFVDKKLGCHKIVELSTLTGSCMVALGDKVAGLWCNCDALAASLLAASKSTGEAMWRMPLVEEYKEGLLDTGNADMNNIGGRHARAISAALFLREFVRENKPFAHIDMAGPVWKATNGGATGWGSKLVTEWICKTAIDHSYK